MDNLVLEKSEIIKNLNEKLEMAQRKLTNYVTESSAQGYTNVKAMNERYQRDREKYAEDLMSNEVSKVWVTILGYTTEIFKYINHRNL